MAAFWQRYLDGLPSSHPHRQAKLDAFAFGDTPSLADELAALVVSGRKRATASLPVEFTSAGLPLPTAGDVSIVLRGGGAPAAVVELTEVRHLALGEVDAAFAADEGEGDGSLEFWRKAHIGYFGRVAARHGLAFGETTQVVCQRFRVVFRAHDT